MALFSLDITQPLVAITASSNTHTIDFDAHGNNYSITANNATNATTGTTPTQLTTASAPNGRVSASVSDRDTKRESNISATESQPRSSQTSSSQHRCPKARIRGP